MSFSVFSPFEVDQKFILKKIMNTKVLNFIFLTTIFLSSINGKPKMKIEKEESNDFDYLILNLSWPPVMCHIWHKEFKPICHSLNQQWSIHGLWPSMKMQESPVYCNSSTKFNFSEIAALKPDLDAKWPNIINGTGEYDLWEHEWSKHGTCAGTIDALNTQLKYFAKTIKLFDEYNISAVLKSAGINPGSSYTEKSILEAVGKKLGRKVGIDCHAEEETNEYFLSSIQLCFDKYFNLTDCVKNDVYPSECPSDMSSSKIEFSDSIINEIPALESLQINY